MAWLLAMLPVLFALVAAALMIDRDITAPSWVKDRVSDRAALILGGGSVDFGDITLRVGRDLHPRIRLTDTTLRDASGAGLAQVTEISGLLSPRGLLFERAALIQEVVFTGTQIGLRRNRDGTVAIDFETGDGGGFEAATLSGLLDAVDAAFDRPALAALETLQVEGLIVNYQDARAGRTWTVDGGTLALDVRGGALAMDAGFLVLSGGNVAELDFSYLSPPETRAADLTLTVADLPAGDLAAQNPALTFLEAVDAPLSGTLSSTIDATGELGVLDAALTLGGGALRPGGQARSLRFDGADLALRYTPSRDHIDISRLSLSSEWGAVSATGQAFATEMVNGLPAVVVAQLAVDHATLNPAGLYPAPQTIDAAWLDLRLTRAPLRVDLGQAVIRQGDMSLQASGWAAARDDGWQAAVDLDLPRGTRDQILSLWPEDGFAPGARRWFAANLLEGAVEDVAAGWRLHPETGARLAASFDYSGVALRYLRDHPLIRDGHGSGHFIDGGLTLIAEGGRIAAPTGGAVEVAGSVMQIADLRDGDGRLDFDLRGDATITAALSLLDLPPFRFMSNANRPVTIADGRTRVAASLSIPKRRPFPPEALRYDVSAALNRVSSTELIPGRRLAGSGLAFSADPTGFRITGPVTLDGVPARGTWAVARGTPGSTVDAQIELSPRALDAFNIALPPGSVAGQGQGRLQLALRPGAAPRFDLQSNLAGVALGLPAVGWSKPANVDGELAVAGVLGATPRIDNLRISGGGLDAEGQISFRPGGGLDAARFDRVRLGNWMNAPITLTGRGPGRAVGVQVRGGSLDLRRARFGRSGGGDGGPVDITLDRLQITEGIALTSFRGAFDGAGGFSGNFTGLVNGGPGVRGSVVPRDGRSAVRVLSDDAGGVVAAAGFLKNGIGGSLDLTLLPAGGAGTFDGFLAVRQIRVRDAPSIAALLDAISVVGLLQQLDGQGLAFDEVDARFRLTPDAVVVSQASAVGPGLGISLDGRYALGPKLLDFQGVVSPFYLLNGIGSVLTRKGEGLIGFNFTLRGPVSDPDVGVNPLSALTPGMFREIFRRPPPELNQ